MPEGRAVSQDAAVVAEVIARLDRTLAAPSARMEYRTDLAHLPQDLTLGIRFVSNAVKMV